VKRKKKFYDIQTHGMYVKKKEINEDCGVTKPPTTT
jgi:hypothetical protein